MRLINLLTLVIFASIITACSEQKVKDELTSQGSEVNSFKTDRILHGEQVANNLVNSLGLQNSGQIDNMYDRAAAARLLLSESGSYDTITGGYLNVMTELSEAACEHLVFDLERGRLQVVDGEVEDNRHYFRGIWLEDAAPNGANTSRVSADYEYTTANYSAAYSPMIRYSRSIKRLARTLWGRDISSTEESEIMALVQSTLDAGAANKGYRAAIIACTAVASSFDSVRQ